MGKLDRISKAGLWPRCMGADVAAIYCGVSKSQFYRLVDNNTYPKPFENGGLVQWDRFDLDEAIENLKRRVKTPLASNDLGKELDEWTPGKSA